MGAQRSRPRAAQEARGRHSVSPRLAAELVHSFRVGSDETVVEIGAGSGRLTRELVRVAGLVVAVELDPALVKGSIGARWTTPNLLVHHGDALEVTLPPIGFRVVGNVPFGISTALLRRFLDDERTTRVDVIVQLELARKHAVPRGHVLPVLWASSWDLQVRRRIPAHRFHPSPSVDAAWLSAVRRDPPLIRPEERRAFERYLRRAFGRADRPVHRSIGVSRANLRSLGCDMDARAVDLEVAEWVRLFRSTARPKGSTPRNSRAGL